MNNTLEDITPLFCHTRRVRQYTNILYIDMNTDSEQIIRHTATW